jgi:TonB family protein
MIFTLFIAKVFLSSGILFGYYWFFLRNRQFHQYNRFYLLTSLVLSVILPFINIPVFIAPDKPAANIVYKAIDVLTISSPQTQETALVEETLATSISAENILTVIYYMGSAVFLFLLFRSILHIRAIAKKYPCEYVDSLRFYNTNEPGTPFSFFKSVFWNEKLDLKSSEGKQIFRHEFFHIKQHHSADILLSEFIIAFLWLNPFFHLIKKELKAIHEFLADEFAFSGTDKYSYAELLIYQSIKAKKISVAQPFFQTNIKRRIAMITSFKNKNYSYASRLLVLPVAFLLFCAFTLYTKHSLVKADLPEALNTPVTVVIDAGHGGYDNGAKALDEITTEKDITLAIAQKIKEYAADYNINVVLTRSNDKHVDNPKRFEIINSTKPVALISLHSSASVTDFIDAGETAARNKNSLGLYFSNQDQFLAKVVWGSLHNIYKQVRGISGKELYPGHKIPCPSLLIDLGSMTQDIERLTSENGQKLISEKIVEALVMFVKARDVLPKFGGSGKEEVQIDTVKPGKAQSKQDDPDKTYVKVDEESRYPGGAKAWLSFLQKSLIYPKQAVEKNIEGMVVFRFVVDTEGNISNIEIKEGPAELREEAIRLMRKSGKWVPAVVSGKSVKAYRVHVIRFNLKDANATSFNYRKEGEPGGYYKDDPDKLYREEQRKPSNDESDNLYKEEPGKTALPNPSKGSTRTDPSANSGPTKTTDASFNYSGNKNKTAPEKILKKTPTKFSYEWEANKNSSPNSNINNPRTTPFKYEKETTKNKKTAKKYRIEPIERTYNRVAGFEPE